MSDSTGLSRLACVAEPSCHQDDLIRGLWLSHGPCSPELSKSYMDMASKLFTFTDAARMSMHDMTSVRRGQHVMTCMCNSHACHQDHAVATVSMHAHAWVLSEAALCANCSACKVIVQHAISVSEHACIKSTDVIPSLGSLL